jgi:hypothetical protein
MKPDFWLTSDDVRFVLTSLDFTKQKFEGYPYQEESIRRLRLADVNEVIDKMRCLRDVLKERERRVGGK